MAQTVPFDALLGASKTGLAIGATIYELDGSTSYAAFSTTGWYEAPAGSGGWHHPGLSLPDAGGVVAVGIAATEYLRIAVDAVLVTATPTNVSDAQTAITNAIAALNNLSTGDLATALGTYDGATGTELSATQTAITNAIAALNNLSSAQAQSAAAAALTAYDPPTKAELDTAESAIIDAVPTAVEIRTELDSNSTQLGKLGTPMGASMSADIAALTAYVDTEVAAILAAVDTEIATLVTNVADILADTGTDGVVLSTAQMQALADIVLGRSVSNAEGAAGLHSITELILAILEGNTSTGSWVIKKTDGSTTFNTRTLTTDANAVPITGVS